MRRSSSSSSSGLSKALATNVVADLPVLLEQLRRLEQPVGDDELAGLEPAELGGEVGLGHRSDVEVAGRDVEPGQRQLRLGLCQRDQEVVAAGLQVVKMGVESQMRLTDGLAQPLPLIFRAYGDRGPHIVSQTGVDSVRRHIPMAVTPGSRHPAVD